MLRMRPRIFMLLLFAFAAVIVLGIGGMVSFFWIAASAFRDNSPQTVMMAPWAAARRLSSYYAERGSWQDLAIELDDIPMRGLHNDRDSILIVLDNNGQVVASNNPQTMVGTLFDPEAIFFSEHDMMMHRERDDLLVPSVPLPPIALQSLPIEVEGRQVGALVVSVSGSTFRPDDGGELQILRGFLGGALGLTVVLLGIAAFVAKRFSTPLRSLTLAAQAFSSGKMEARVPNYRIREIDELGLAFNSMADSLMQADQQRRQLTADVAHELRTPLSVIKGRLEGIQDGIYTADGKQIDGLLSEVALLERLIEDLRLLALADAGQLPLYFEPVDPVELVWDAHHAFAHAAEERGVTLEIVAEEELPEIAADPQRIAQVLGNLISNALRYTPSGGQVAVSASASAETVAFAVRDSGSGIAAEDLPRIFDRFYRADRSRTRSSGGAGLGLAIVRRIVEAHGGSITAESTVGSGTTFRFSVPIAK